MDEGQSRVLSALLAMQRESWEQGVASHAALDLGLHPVAHAIARDSVVRQRSDGRLGELGEQAVTNSGSLGEVVHWAAAESAHPDLETAYRRQLDWLLREAPRASDGTLYHLTGSHEVWVDTVYMVVPVLILAGEESAAIQQFEGHRVRLFDASAGLYMARWDEDTTTAHHPQHWGTGSGWVVAAIARALHLAPDSGSAFARHVSGHAQAVIDACLALRGEQGLFHNVVDDPQTFAEGNLGQMLAYGILTGVADGWLPASYESAGRSLVATSRALVDAHGFVQNVCGAPHFDRPGVSAEAQAVHLLATDAERRLDEVLAGI